MTMEREARLIGTWPGTQRSARRRGNAQGDEQMATSTKHGQKKATATTRAAAKKQGAANSSTVEKLRDVVTGVNRGVDEARTQRSEPQGSAPPLDTGLQSEATTTRDATGKRKAAASSTGSEVYTAVSRNGLAHRRCDIVFGAEPVAVDISGWTDEMRERFFGDKLLMIVRGQMEVAERFAEPETGLPREFLAGGGEVATPAMARAAANGRPMTHPSRLASGGPVGAPVRTLAGQQVADEANEDLEDELARGEVDE